MIGQDDAEELMGRTAVDADGASLGEIDQVYLDPDSGEPLWVTVATGILGSKPKLVPAPGRRLDDDGQVVLAVTGELVDSVPDVVDDTQLTAAEQEALLGHYSGVLSPAVVGEPEQRPA